MNKKEKLSSEAFHEPDWLQVLSQEDIDYWKAYLRSLPVVGPKLKERDKLSVL